MWAKIAKEQMNPLLSRQAMHGETVTVARIEAKKGCVVPEHAHHNEQVSIMEKGRVKFVIGGVERVLGAGDMAHMPPNVPHHVEVLEDAVIVDVFSPCREDWKRGDDAYLRK